VSKRRTISGRTVVITGAASGIGRALAQRLSAHSCPVAIADVDELGLCVTPASARIRKIGAATSLRWLTSSPRSP
jgi:NAD(P)-dependent dehydrogenase (short-subunit alcohol dehydrogenase family)